MDERQHNWAGNYTYRAPTIREPATLDELRRLVAGSSQVRALGSRHSFNAIADSADLLVSLSRLDRITALDAERRTVTVEGGTRYGALGTHLHTHGFALPNLASLPHISVAGACATATHGSGERNGNLATSVSAMDVISPDGDVVSVSRASSGPDFDGMVVSLGALGIISSLTLDIVPTFEVRQTLFERLSLAKAIADFDAIQASAYSVSLFTTWQGDQFDQVWLKETADSPTRQETFHGATRAIQDLHPIPGVSAESCTPQMGVAGAWHDRLPHFRMDFTPSNGQELQSEYFVPRERASAALRAVMGLGDRIAPLLLISEVRTIAADHLWMSPCYEQSSVAMHFTWKQQSPEVEALLPDLEAALAPFGARPHWGKLFTMSPSQVASRFTRMPDFRRMLMTHDPRGKFRNDFIERYVTGT